jgi:hypothetical protein
MPYGCRHSIPRECRAFDPSAVRLFVLGLIGIMQLQPGEINPWARIEVLPPPHDGQNIKNPPPVLPDESSSLCKNISLSERKNL